MQAVNKKSLTKIHVLNALIVFTLIGTLLAQPCLRQEMC